MHVMKIKMQMQQCIITLPRFYGAERECSYMLTVESSGTILESFEAYSYFGS